MNDSSSNIFQLGKALYIAHCREAVNQMGKDFDEWTGGEEKAWAELHPDSRACWYATAERALELNRVLEARLVQATRVVEAARYLLSLTECDSRAAPFGDVFSRLRQAIKNIDTDAEVQRGK